MTQTASQLSLEPELQEGRDESSEEKKASSFSSAYAQQPHSKKNNLAFFSDQGVHKQ